MFKQKEKPSLPYGTGLAADPSNPASKVSFQPTLFAADPSNPASKVSNQHCII